MIGPGPVDGLSVYFSLFYFTLHRIIRTIRLGFINYADFFSLLRHLTNLAKRFRGMGGGGRASLIVNSPKQSFLSFNHFLYRLSLLLFLLIYYYFCNEEKPSFNNNVLVWWKSKLICTSIHEKKRAFLWIIFKSRLSIVFDQFLPSIGLGYIYIKSMTFFLLPNFISKIHLQRVIITATLIMLKEVVSGLYIYTTRTVRDVAWIFWTIWIVKLYLKKNLIH